MLNINPLRTDIFCLPQRFSTFYQVLNNCDKKLTLTSLLAWKHNKIRFCSFKCCQKIPLAIKVHLGIKSDGVRKSGFSDIRDVSGVKFVPYSLPPPFLADFLKGPQRFLLSCQNVIIYPYSSVWCFRQKGTTHYEVFFKVQYVLLFALQTVYEDPKYVYSVRVSAFPSHICMKCHCFVHVCYTVFHLLS